MARTAPVSFSVFWTTLLAIAGCVNGHQGLRSHLLEKLGVMIGLMLEFAIWDPCRRCLELNISRFRSIA
jgi:hypothetical protein